MLSRQKITIAQTMQNSPSESHSTITFSMILFATDNKLINKVLALWKSLHIVLEWLWQQKTWTNPRNNCALDTSCQQRRMPPSRQGDVCRNTISHIRLFIVLSSNDIKDFQMQIFTSHKVLCMESLQWRTVKTSLSWSHLDRDIITENTRSLFWRWVAIGSKVTWAKWT